MSVINLKHSHWQWIWLPNRRQCGQLTVALLRGTSHFMWNLCSTAGAAMHLLTTAWSGHSAKSALWAFAAAWKVWLSQSTEELSDNEQEDVVDSAAQDVYCLGGSDTSNTLVEEGVGGAGYAGGGAWLIQQCQCLYWHVLVQVLKQMLPVCVFVCIGACIGLYLILYWSVYVLACIVIHTNMYPQYLACIVVCIQSIFAWIIIQ